MPSEPGTLSMNTYTTNNYVNWFHFKLMLCHFTQSALNPFGSVRNLNLFLSYGLGACKSTSLRT